MSTTGSIAIYVIIWWLVLFVVLPLGAKQKIDPADVAEGQDPGAPAKPMMAMKVLLTTAISMVVFAIFYFAYTSGWISLRPE